VDRCDPRPGADVLQEGQSVCRETDEELLYDGRKSFLSGVCVCGCEVVVMFDVVVESTLLFWRICDSVAFVDVHCASL